MRTALLAVSLVLGCSHAGHAGDWPAWRGPNADGVSEDRNLPLTWGKDQNIKWRVPLPGPGNSTPIIWKDQVFLTQALDGGTRRALIAFARSNGAKLWQQEVPCAVVETTHPTNPPCSSSPVTDGKAVYADFASGGVLACDLAGKRLWHRDFGPLRHKWGNGSSPVAYRGVTKDLLIVFRGPGEPCFMTALDKKTGQTVWKQDETAINSPIFGSWSTPVIIPWRGRDELVMPLPGDRIGGEGYFKAYNPETGAELWRCGGLGNEVYAMPAVSALGDLVVGISGHNGPTVAVRPGGHRDATATHRIWRVEKNPQRIGGGVIHEGRLYLADADGFAECLATRDGSVIWKERLGGKTWGTMLRAGDRLYVSNVEGQTFVLEAGPKFRLLAKNDLGEPIYAAFGVADGEIFLRTYKHLYCISAWK